ncbi:MAG: 50S ribosomal protein L16 [Mycoplasmataceae bacterium RC_NB112A]|nr:MAG: 50S ribosomal protein L16 [Mycoplasmataceae bacterium RC_NB112A]KLL01873.1 MAG: 50S ribosomal protein L16 [Mycoplasmataceae bacterium RC_NB112A]
MVLTPSKTKYPFNFCPKYEGHAKGNQELHQGQFGLQALTGSYLSNRTFESVRLVVKDLARKYGWKIHWNIFPHWGKTKKPIGVRMGSGKGSVEEWVAVVKAGTIILEVIVPEKTNLSLKEVKELEKRMEETRQILKSAIHKLPKGKGKKGKKWEIVEKSQEN